MRLSRLVVPLLVMWLFGNLYEQIVWNPQLLADPRPGSLVGVFAAGSPIYYYLPWAPLPGGTIEVRKIGEAEDYPEEIAEASRMSQEGPEQTYDR